MIIIAKFKTASGGLDLEKALLMPNFDPIGLNFLKDHKFCVDIKKGEVSVDI